MSQILVRTALLAAVISAGDAPARGLQGEETSSTAIATTQQTTSTTTVTTTTTTTTNTEENKSKVDPAPVKLNKVNNDDLTHTHHHVHRKVNDFEHVHDGEKYVLVTDQQRNFRGARKHCLGLGGDLASIADEKENNEIHEIIDQGAKQAYWIGAQEEDGKDNKWQWSDGVAWDYTKWAAGEPNNNNKGKNTEGCVELNRYKGKKVWNDTKCSKKNYYICKIDEERQNRFARIKGAKREAEQIKLIKEEEEEATAMWVETNEKAYQLAEVTCECKQTRRYGGQGRRLSHSRSGKGKKKGKKHKKGKHCKGKKGKGKKGKKGHRHSCRSYSRSRSKSRSKSRSRSKSPNKFVVIDIRRRDKCAKEGGSCKCNGEVYYGTWRSIMKDRRQRFAVLQSTGRIGCNNRVFGDPLRGTRKACFCIPDKSTVVVKEETTIITEQTIRTEKCIEQTRETTKEITMADETVFTDLNITNRSPLYAYDTCTCDSAVAQVYQKGITYGQFENDKVKLWDHKMQLVQLSRDKVELGGCIDKDEALLVRWSERSVAVEEMTEIEETYMESMTQAESIVILTDEEVTEERQIEQEQLLWELKRTTVAKEQKIIGEFEKAKDNFNANLMSQGELDAFGNQQSEDMKEVRDSFEDKRRDIILRDDETFTAGIKRTVARIEKQKIIKTTKKVTKKTIRTTKTTLRKQMRETNRMMCRGQPKIGGNDLLLELKVRGSIRRFTKRWEKRVEKIRKCQVNEITIRKEERRVRYEKQQQLRVRALL